jgi:hypothetical protein
MAPLLERWRYLLWRFLKQRKDTRKRQRRKSVAMRGERNMLPVDPRDAKADGTRHW